MKKSCLIQREKKVLKLIIHIVKYSNLEQTHHFVPIAIETSGVFGPATAVFIKELGHRLRRVTGDDLSRLICFLFFYLTAYIVLQCVVLHCIIICNCLQVKK